MKQQVIEKITNKKIIAIVRGYSIEECIKLAEALQKGGVELMEVTFPQTNIEEMQYTAETIRRLKETLGDKMEFGAGTVTSVEMVKMAKDAGATFIISPDTNADVIKASVEYDLVSIPGAFTPTEMKTAHDLGADFVKVFPANCFGPSYIKTVKAPLSQIKYLAVGGVNEKTINEYLANGASGAGVAGCLFKKEWIKAGEWDKITAAAKNMYKVMEEAK